MRVERYQARPKRRFPILGCGCGFMAFATLIMFTVVVILIVPMLPALGLRLAGFQALSGSLGDTTPEPIPAINNAQPVAGIVLSAGTYGQRTIPQSSAYTVQTGTDDSGAQIVQITMPESSMDLLCDQYTTACSGSGNPFRNADVVLENNRATLSGDVFIDSLNTWQPVSVITGLTPDNRVEVQAVEVGGTLFGVPDGELGQRIREIQSTANDAIQQLNVQHNGATYNLADITVTGSQLVATFR